MAENGCSLEDCHTNLFAVADLAGIKWRRLGTQSDSTYTVDPLEDPVLVSYSKCVLADLLCVWRKQPKNTGSGSVGIKNSNMVDHGASNPKELWLFWYGEEPVSLQSFISSDLYEVEAGSWDSGPLSYECRTLLFKAFHNLIERCLMAQNFARVGRWFVQPYNSLDQLQKDSPHMSMSFNFFLHGDSTVCVSVDVRQRAPLFSLSSQHLSFAAQLTPSPSVILAPYGLRGLLTGRTSVESEHKTQQRVEEWKKFYFINRAEDSSEAGSSLPSMVEVVVAGAKLSYPSCYVLVSIDMEMEMRTRQSSTSSSSTSPQNMALVTRGSSISRRHPYKVKSLDVKQNSSIKSILARRVVEKSWQDWIVASGVINNSSQSETSENKTDSQSNTLDRVSWDFGDPTQKGNCGCLRLKSSKNVRYPTSTSASLGNKSIQSISSFGTANMSSWKQHQHPVNFKGDRGLSDHRPRHQRAFAPYHRRNKNHLNTSSSQESRFVENANYILSHEFGHLPKHSNMPVSTSSFMSTSTNSSNLSQADSHKNQQHPQGVVPTSKAILQQMTLGLDSSPNSAAPSPLMATTQGQLSSISQNGGDPTMPTLSPQPPTKTGDSRTSTKEGTTADASFKSNQVADSGGSSATGSFIRVSADLKTDQDGGRSNQGDLSRSESVIPQLRPPDIGKTWIEKQMKKRSKVLSSSLLKRPTLNPLFGEEEDEGIQTRSFYECPLDPVLEFVRRQKSIVKTAPNSAYQSKTGLPSDSYHLTDVDSSNGGHAGTRDNRMVTMVKEEYPSVLPHIKLEDERQGGMNIDNRPGCYDDTRNVTELPPSPTGRPVLMTTTTLMRENDLIPNILDLDKMFDTDEECDPESPSTMMRQEKNREDGYGSSHRATSNIANHSSLVPNQGVLSTKELSRMYPTPPSADNPCSEPSPMMQGGADGDVHHDSLHFTQQPQLCQQMQQQYSSGQSFFIKEEQGSISAALAAFKKEYASLYKIPLWCKMPTSSDYDPVDLPHDNRPSIHHHLIYKLKQTPSLSSSLQHHHIPDRAMSSAKFISSSSFDMSHSNGGNNRRPDFVTPFFNSQVQQQHNMNSLLLQQQQQHLMQQQRTPLSYEHPSPASSASSLSRPINSIENIHSGSAGEVSGLMVNIALSDSMMNIFKDHNFDSCTLCACNRNIDGSDINTYLIPQNRSSATSEEQFRCTCAFSAIVNRRYGLQSGLFYEDEVEITGVYRREFDKVYKPSLLVNKNQEKQQLMGNNSNNSNNNNNNSTTTIINNSNNSSNNPGSIDEEISHEVFTLLREQFSTQFPSMAALANFKTQTTGQTTTEYARSLEIEDCKEACYAALEFSRQLTADSCSQSYIDRNDHCVHPWPFLQGPAPIASNSQEVVRLLKQLQPLLQDAIQKRKTAKLWESVYTISGPLTWKDFHLLAGRGSKETSEPKSVPYLLVGYDKDWMALSPHAIKHWDKLMLEPLSEPRDVFYLVVAPENDVILDHASTFFNELGVLYEQCKLGRHRILNEKLRGGIVRVGKTNEARIKEELDDEWFKDIGDSPTAVKLRLYAKICCIMLVNLLLKNLPEKRKLYEEAAKSHSSAGGSRFSISNPDQPPSSLYSTTTPSSSFSSPHPPQSSHNHNIVPPQSMMMPHQFGHTESHHSGVFAADRDHMGSEQSQRDSHTGGEGDSHESSDQHNTGFSLEVVSAGQMPYIVIYIVDPFSYTVSGEKDNNSRLAYLGLLRTFNNMLKLMPEELRSSIQLQIVPQQTLLSVSQPMTVQHMKSLCFSVYTSCRRTLKHSTLGRTLTGFGPAASAKKLMKLLYPSVQIPESTGGTGVVTFGNMGLPVNTPVTTITTTMLYCPPYILAPPSLQSGATSSLLPETLKEPIEKSGILLCAYCLSEDQRFLLASLVDSTGELLETTCINIDVPNRSLRRRALVRRFALQKLWEFILGIIACTTRAWRLVVGRFGRLGHGELKGWSTILSKRNLLASSHHLRRICQLCNITAAGQCPAILSACLVSTELHPTIHIMIDSVKREENQSSKRQLSTPRDASCTHILVYPTSATAQATDSSTADTHMDFTSNELLNAEELLNGFETEDPEMISDFWCNLDDSPNRMMEDDISPHDDPTSIFGGSEGGGSQSRGMGMSSQAAMEQEENSNLNLLQQPQAMGFYVSTAQPGPLPEWFWSSCPQREGHCPVCFKASLHLHCPMVQQNQDDLIHQSNAHKKPTHPLDSYLTCDVLRYVLETYNTLSWLTIDPSTNDRRSCLPVHMLILMQLYHGIKTFV